MIISFPYVKEKVREGFILRPKIPIIISNAGKEIKLIGTLDTGSDITIIPRGPSEFLELDLTGKSYTIEGIGGGSLDCIQTFVNLKAGEYTLLHQPIMVPLTPEYQDTIFGRKPIFEEFDITFRENSKKVELVKIRH